MKQITASRATLSRLPIYLQYVKKIEDTNVNISATSIAEALGLGDVQVRKDLGSVCGSGRPKTGYVTSELIDRLEDYLGYKKTSNAVIIGAGQLGMALLNYDGFKKFGLEILAAFDKKFGAELKLDNGRVIVPIDGFSDFCRSHDVHLGIIAVPESAAQEVCDMMLENGIKAIWNFAHCEVNVPSDIVVKNEDLALSLAYLNQQVKDKEGSI